MPWNRKEYPAEWEAMRAAVLARANNRCEGSRYYPDCRAENHQPHPITGSRVVLTCAHLYERDKHTTDITRIKALCQRCHLALDRHIHVARAARTRARKKVLAEKQRMEVAS